MSATDADAGHELDPNAGARHELDPVAGAVSRGARRPLIGVIGGLGPAATVDFYAKVVAATVASRDQEHVRLLIDGDPEVPDRSGAIAGTGESSGPALIDKARRLAAAGADLLVMPCNSAHAFEADIRASVDLPFVSIVEEAVRRAADLLPPTEDHTPSGAGQVTAERTENGVRPGVGVLATSGTHAAGIYRTVLARHDLTMVEPMPDEIELFMRLVTRIKGGEASDAGVKSAMARLAASLVERGAAVIIAGCTEAPLVLDDSALTAELRSRGLPPAAFVDSTAALASAVVALGTGLRDPYSSVETVRAKL